MRIAAIFLLLMFASAATVKAQSIKQNYFRLESPTELTDKDYGVVTISTDSGETKVVNYIMAFGDNVKGLFVQLNDGFGYELAPAAAGYSLNYIGSSLNIVLKDGDKAKIKFTTIINGKREAIRHIYLSGYSVK